MRIFIPVLILTFLFYSCNNNSKKQINKASLVDGIYQNDEIGWTMKIPDGWNIINGEELEKRQSKGDEIITESMKMQYQGNPNAKLLINFQKDQLNFFQSTLEPIKNVKVWQKK